MLMMNSVFSETDNLAFIHNLCETYAEDNALSLDPRQNPNVKRGLRNEDGTGVQASYSGAIEFTYTWDGDTATITNEEMGVSAEVTLEDGVLYTDYSSFVKVDEAEYIPENQETGGSESVLNGSYTDAEGLITITFDGAGTFGYSNNEIGEAGSGTYTYDGMTLVVTIFQNGEEVSHEGSVREEDYAVYISLWDDSNIYYAD